MKEDFEDFAHCYYCDVVINLDNEDFTIKEDETFCSDCKSEIIA